MSNFPNSKDSFVYVQGEDYTDEYDHAGMHQSEASAIEALENTVGVTNDGNTNSHDYRIKRLENAQSDNKVSSVNGKTGDVVLDAGDLGLNSTDDLPEGIKKYYASSLFNIDFGTKNTDDLTEGTHKFYSSSLFDIDFGGKSTTDLDEGSNLYFTNARVSANTDVSQSKTHTNISHANPHGTDLSQLGDVTLIEPVAEGEILTYYADSWTNRVVGAAGLVVGPSIATNNAIPLFDGTSGKLLKDSTKTIVTTLGADNTTIPTSKAVQDAINLEDIWDRTGTVISPNTPGDSLKINTINEETVDNGVDIETVHLENGDVSATSFTIGANTLTTSEFGYLDGQNQTVATTSSPTFANITDSAMTAGSILFAGTAGLISQDNSNFFWDNINKRLGLGIITPADAIHIVNTLGSNIILNTNTGTVSTGIYMTEGPSGTSKNNGAYVYYNGSTNTFNIATGSGSPTDKLTIERDTGNVGIGTTSPTFGSITGKGMEIEDTSNTPGLRIQGPTTGALELYCNNGVATIESRPAIGSIATLVFKTEGSERMRIASTGNVGIGTTSPTLGKLQIVQSVDTSSGGITVLDSTSTRNIRIYTTTSAGYIEGNSGGTTNLVLNSGGGNVGIGTSSPGYLLHLYKSGADVPLGFDSGSGTTFVAYKNHASDYFAIRHSGTADRLVISNTGNVGIGTTSPISELDVVGNIIATSSHSTSTEKAGRFGTNHYNTSEEPFYGVYTYSASTNNILLLGGGTSAGNAATIISFYTAANTTTLTGTERMRIDSAGNVGIGTTSPVGKLEINASSIYHLMLNNTLGTENKRIFGFAVGDSSQNLNINALNDSHSWVRGLMTIQHGGNIGIGTTSPTQKFEINGGATHGFPLTSGTTQTYGRFRLENNEASNAVLDIGIYGTNGAWIQATLKTDLSTNYPLLLNPNGGNVGIGTTNPQGALEVSNLNSNTGNTILIRNPTEAIGTDVGGLRFVTGSGVISSTNAIAGIEADITQANPDTLKGDLTFSTNIGDSYTEKMRITSTGNVGIETTSPSYKLQIQDTTAQTTGMYLLKTQATTDNIVNFNSTIQINHTSGTRASAIGIYSSTSATGSGGTTTSVYTFHSAATINAGATVTNLYGLYIGAPTNSGTITSHYGLFVAGQTSATNNYGLYLQNSQYNTMTCLARDGVLYLNEGSATASQYYSISFLRTHSDTGANVATIDAEMLGAIHWRGNSGTGVTYGAGIYAKQIGSAGTTTPTALYFQTADGTNAMATRLYILPTGESLFGTGTTSIAVGGIAGKIQVQGTDAGKSSITTTRYSNDANPAYIAFGKSRGSTVGTYTIVQDNDILGRIDFNASDGTDINSRGASIFARINGTPGSNDVPTELVFCTTADGASDVTEHMAIDSTGAVTIYGFTPSLTFTDINTSADSVIDCNSNAGSMFISADQNNESANTVMAFKVDGTERGRFTSNGNFLVGSTDDDGTPATGRLVVQGSTNDGSTNIFVGRDSDGANVFTVDTNGVITTSQYRLSALNTAPANAGDTGTLGEIRIVDGYIYVCTATNTWKRVAIATW